MVASLVRALSDLLVNLVRFRKHLCHGLKAICQLPSLRVHPGGLVVEVSDRSSFSEEGLPGLVPREDCTND